ncbi:Protein ENHANCED DISEASE RESISTANCE [Arachis hypogaea]|nr:Protein ENHANCED DISEASE RESISTANCE [Arachis hypogaea]
MAVGVVDGSSEAIFQTLMSLGPSRSAWDVCFYKGSVVEHVDGHIDVIHKELYRDWLPWDSKLKYDFKGGAQVQIRCAEPNSQKTPIDNDLSDIRHSRRITRKSYKYDGKSPCPVVVDIDNEDTTEVDQVREENKEHASDLKSKKVPRSASATTANNEVVSSNNANNILLEELKLFAHNG